MTRTLTLIKGDGKRTEGIRPQYIGPTLIHDRDGLSYRFDPKRDHLRWEGGDDTQPDEAA